MGEHFPAIKDKDVIKIARKLGFVYYRQAKRSHEIWRRAKDSRYTTIPRHSGKILKRKTLKSIIEDFDISVKEFQTLLRKK